MRYVPYTDGMFEDVSNVSMDASSAEDVDECLNALDDQLKKFGLEIVKYDGAPVALWRIEKADRSA